MNSMDSYLIWQQQGKNVPLDEQLTIGRGIPGDEQDQYRLYLPEPTVSREHAVLIQQKGLWRLLNKSRNGTLVNSEVIQESMLLKNGDCIHIGNHTLVFCDSMSDTMEIAISEYKPQEKSELEDRWEAAIFFASFIFISFLLLFLVHIFER